MREAQFLRVRGPAWDRLSALIAKGGRKGASGLTGAELHELIRLYPAVAVDVARARALNVDAATQRGINALAISAHGMLYRRKHVSWLRALWTFLSRDYPRLFRAQWVAMVISLGIFAVGTLGTYAAVRVVPSMAYVFVPRGLDVGSTEMPVGAEDVSERYRQMARAPMASMIMGNNISVAFAAFALGITAGVGTCYVLLANSMMLGAFFAHFANHGLSYVCWSFLAPHGLLEVFAILVAAAAGLRLGLSLAVPGALSRRASLRLAGRQAVMLVIGTIPMFIIAGAIEGFITPAHNISGGAKIAIGVVAWVSVLGYLLLAGKGRDAAVDTTAPSPVQPR